MVDGKFHHLQHMLVALALGDIVGYPDGACFAPFPVPIFEACLRAYFQPAQLAIAACDAAFDIDRAVTLWGMGQADSRRESVAVFGKHAFH